MTALPPPVVHVSEVFGPTVQGEGPACGRLAVFVRLGGCNLTCGGCDTPYTWDARRHDLRVQITPIPAPAVAAEVRDRHGGRPGLAVLSGGEPLIHQHSPGMRTLVETLTGHGHPVHVETNGTIAPAGWMRDLPAVMWVVSPKVAGPLATDPAERRLRPDVLRRWVELAHAGRATFKIVCGSAADVDAAADLAADLDLDHDRLYVMPAGTTAGQVLAVGQAIADAATGHRMHITTRLHLLLWPDEDRGR